MNERLNAIVNAQKCWDQRDADPDQRYGTGIATDSPALYAAYCKGHRFGTSGGAMGYPIIVFIPINPCVV